MEIENNIPPLPHVLADFEKLWRHLVHHEQKFLLYHETETDQYITSTLDGPGILRLNLEYLNHENTEEGILALIAIGLVIFREASNKIKEKISIKWKGLFVISAPLAPLLSDNEDKYPCIVMCFPESSFSTSSIDTNIFGSIPYETYPGYKYDNKLYIVEEIFKDDPEKTKQEQGNILLETYYNFRETSIVPNTSKVWKEIPSEQIVNFMEDGTISKV